MKVVQRQAEPARHRKLAMLFLRPALQDETFMQELVSKQQEDQQETGSKVRFFTQVPQKFERSFKKFD